MLIVPTAVRSGRRRVSPPAPLLTFALALVLLLFAIAPSRGDEPDSAAASSCDDDDAAAADGVVAGSGGAIGTERTQRDYYAKASHYDALWGPDNLHLGYFPHLSPGTSSTRVKLMPAQAAMALTERMIDVAGIGPTDRVLDLGSGKGLACAEIAATTGASCTGVDLTPPNVARARELARSRPGADLRFHVGSFTDLPAAALADGPYDVVFSQVAFCHVHASLPEIFAQALRALRPGGRLLVNDYLGGDGEPGPATLEHVYKRLHFDKLHGHRAWRAIADAARGADGGRLELRRYEGLDDHMREFYAALAAAAEGRGFASVDGTSLATNYNETVAAVDRRELGMNLALYVRV